MATREERGERIRACDDAPDAETEQEVANRLFVQRVESLPGILRVEQHVDSNSGERSFRVSVRQGDRGAGYAVYQLEAEIYQLHPSVYLDVQVMAEADGATIAAPPRAPAP